MKTIYITEEQREKIREFESLFEKKVPTAQGQVHNKVNSGIMDAVTCCGTMEEGAEPDCDDNFTLGFENNGNIKELNPNYHVNEGENDEESEIRKRCHEIEKFMEKEGLNVSPFPKLNLDWSEQDGLFIRTGFYSPEDKSITVFCKERHIKDILRSFSHELIHHMQNLEGKNLNFSSEDDVKDNKELEKIEAEAYLKGNIYFRKWTEYENSEGRNILKESKIIDETNPEDVDLSSFNIKRELNPKFWKNNLLDSRIRLKLMDIADDFIEYLGVDWVEPDDVIVTGSLANFNWNKEYSDIDLHVLIDFSKVDEKTDFVKKYFDSLKNQWNEEHKDLNVFGFPVEVYVQDTNEMHTSSGVYSLDKNEWITEPSKNKLTNSKINKQLIKTDVAKYIDIIDNLISFYEKNKDDDHKMEILYKKIEKLLFNIKNKRKNSLKSEKNEMSNGNLFYKALRRFGYLDKIYELKTKVYDKINSLP